VLVGEVRIYRTVYEDTLLDVARANDLGFTEMVAANPGVDPWLPGEGTVVTLPTGHLLPDAPHTGIVINLGDQRLYVFRKPGEPPLTFPIGTGREGWDTPLGRTSIVRKEPKPTWIPGPAVRAEQPDLPAVVPPGPANPLGDYAFYLGFDGFLLHGTNRPWGVGRRVSHGCIRLYPEDIAFLFDKIRVGTPVLIVDQRVKAGWVDGVLYLEAHPEATQIAALEDTGVLGQAPIDPIDDETMELIRTTAGDAFAWIDWAKVKETLAGRPGLPVAIARNVPPD
jgi:L,D-transpeptidase ErfK/SrfK